jgi:hypothetical protein
MQTLSDEGRRTLNDIAARYGVSFNAVETLLMAVMAGGGTQAQFNHPELGGMGQWSQGGMIMIGDMFNNGLKYTVDGLCNELSNLIRSANLYMPPVSQQSQSQYQGSGSSSGVSLFVPGSFSSGNWWPGDLGHAASVGSQNDLRYAFFPSSRRLAISVGGRVTVYDTRDHQIGGFSQQQGGDQSLSFTSQYGLVRVSDLEVVGPAAEPVAETPVPQKQAEMPAPVVAAVAEPVPEPHAEFVQPTFAQAEPAQSAVVQPVATQPAATANEDDIISKIERLAALHAKGILTDEEFGTKKAELLSRL